MCTRGCDDLPLCAQFDGVKYVVRKCEDLLYELSLAGKYTAADTAPAAKKQRTAVDEYPRITAADFDKMRESLEAADAVREQVIKRTRDVQKLSKQAIYSLHRGDGPKAEAQLNEASEKARAIDVELLASNPTLRSGSFSNAIEELAEARLTQVWFEDESRTIAPPSHAKFGGLVQTIEYLGGLADFTGEVGRWAVAAAARRDEAAVRAALAADQACLRTWMALQVRRITVCVRRRTRTPFGTETRLGCARRLAES